MTLQEANPILEEKYIMEKQSNSYTRSNSKWATLTTTTWPGSVIQGKETRKWEKQLIGQCHLQKQKKRIPIICPLFGRLPWSKLGFK